MIKKKEILECLMEMCSQYLAKDPEGTYYHHDFMAAGENALDLLKRVGLAETEDDVDYKLLWDNLDNIHEQ